MCIPGRKILFSAQEAQVRPLPLALALGTSQAGMLPQKPAQLVQGMLRQQLVQLVQGMLRQQLAQLVPGMLLQQLAQGTLPQQPAQVGDSGLRP